MDGSILLRGLVIGLSIAAPVGPIGVLCIRRTLAEGRATGLAVGLGAATADALYGAIAAGGLTLVTTFLVGQQSALRLGGGLFLCLLGLQTLRARPSTQAATVAGGRGLLAAYAATFALTLTNPATILSFAAIFAGLGGPNASDAGAAALLVGGVFLGSAAWWLLLTTGVSLLRGLFTPARQQWVNRLSGAVLLLFGLLTLGSLLGVGGRG